jgi:hypothetical protein
MAIWQAFMRHSSLTLTIASYLNMEHHSTAGTFCHTPADQATPPLQVPGQPGLPKRGDCLVLGPPQ